MNDLICEFLKTGRLGILALGMTYKDVEQSIKGAGENSLKATNTRVVWWLGGIELSFFKGKLDIISVKWKNGNAEIPQELSNFGAIRLPPFDRDELVLFLKANEIEHEKYDRECSENITCIRISSGVQVYFEDKAVQSIVMM